MGVICYFTHLGLNTWLPDWMWVSVLGKSGWVLARIFKVGTVIVEGGMVIFFVGHWIGVTETTEAVDIFAKKLKNILNGLKT